MMWSFMISIIVRISSIIGTYKRNLLTKQFRTSSRHLPLENLYKQSLALKAAINTSIQKRCSRRQILVSTGAYIKSYKKMLINNF